MLLLDHNTAKFKQHIPDFVNLIIYGLMKNN